MLIKGTTVIEKKMCYISHVKNVVVVTRGMCKRDFCYRFAQERIFATELYKNTNVSQKMVQHYRLGLDLELAQFK